MIRRGGHAGPGPMREFDPRRVGRRECRAWTAYYRREWAAFLAAAVGMVRAGFRMSWPRTALGAGLVLAANVRWAPYPDNDPDAARRHMRRFYRLVAGAHGERFDPTEAARREVEWWRVHRELQRERPGADPEPLVDALAAAAAYVYGVPAADVRPAAVERAAAMACSDRWVAAGCDPASPLVLQVQAALVRSYAALLAAVHRPPGDTPAGTVAVE